MVRKFRGSGSTPTFTSEDVNIYIYEFAKTYLYKVANRQIKDPQLEIISTVAGVFHDYFYIKLLTASDDEKGTEIRINDGTVLATVLYCKKIYQVAVTKFKRYDENTYFMLQAQGTGEGARFTSGLLSHIKRGAIAASSYNDAALEAVPSTEIANTEIDIKPISGFSDSLSELFLPAHINESISLFVKTLCSFETDKKSLRYLFSGKPGTAKTKIIRAIANTCKGKATFIFTNGSETRIDKLFDLTKIFSPVVICIDDIDLMTGTREDGTHSRALAAFLQKMDGFVDTNFFFLGTTNDKQMVDLAASRPGRFDMIIDVDQINQSSYFDLIKSKTKNDKVLNLFDTGMLILLQEKRVTGAFICNLVKHLELIDRHNPTLLNELYVNQIISEQQNGFYNIPEFDRKKVGFGG